MPQRPTQSERQAWWTLFALWALMGVAWALATPPVTGPDEVEQARRAAAVVRGELIGARQPGVPPLVVDVAVPDTYGEASVDHWRCFLGPLVSGSPQEAMVLPPSTCPPISSSRDLVTVQTVQYRGQPFFYAWVGLGTWAPGVSGMYLMRLLSIVPVAALLASACPGPPGGRPRWARLARLGGDGHADGLVPGRQHEPERARDRRRHRRLGGRAGPGRPRGVHRPPGVARFGVALVVLAARREASAPCSPLRCWPAWPRWPAGVGPPNWAGVARCGPGARCWAAAVALSGAWLAHLQSNYALPERAGTGWATALGYLPWYLRQAIGVFGTNDSALHPVVAGAWVAVAIAVIATGLARASGRARLVAGAALVAGLAIQVTAEGLSIPPIGFFWQGRYALPLLVGAVLVATASPARRAQVSPASARASLVGVLGGAAATVLAVVHALAFLTVLRHYTAEGSGSLGVADALFDPRWNPPVAPLALVVVFAAATVATLAVLLGSVPARPVGSGVVDTSPTQPVSTGA